VRAAPPARARTATRTWIDGKLVIQDTLVLDATVRPDFSQVESDEPQSNVNQRYEVFYPEKRPFFMENASYFDLPTATTLLFTRRIVDPEFGARLTGKAGAWAIGTLVADDRSPGELPQAGTLEGEKARFEVVRVSRDLRGQSNLGVFLTGRDLAGGYNRVVAVDGKFKLAQDWWPALLAAGAGRPPPENAPAARRTRPAWEDRPVFQRRHRLHRPQPGVRHQVGSFATDIRDLWPTLSCAFWPQSGPVTSHPTLDADCTGLPGHAAPEQGKAQPPRRAHPGSARSSSGTKRARRARPATSPSSRARSTCSGPAASRSRLGRPLPPVAGAAGPGPGSTSSRRPGQPDLAWYTHGRPRCPFFRTLARDQNSYLLDRLETGPPEGIFTTTSCAPEWNCRSPELSLR
jgi:hypothetical protein